jgi:hypothetical protein
MKVLLVCGVAICALAVGAMLVGRHLNPQPLPPGYQQDVTRAKEQHPVPARGGDAVGSP